MVDKSRNIGNGKEGKGKEGKGRERKGKEGKDVLVLCGGYI